MHSLPQNPVTARPPRQTLLADLGQDTACGFTFVAEGCISCRLGKNECLQTHLPEQAVLTPGKNALTYLSKQC